MGLLALASLAIGVAAPWVVKVLEHGTAPVGGGAAIGHISQLGWLIEPGYPKFASISPTVLALTLDRLRARRRRPAVPGQPAPGPAAPVWASGVAVSGRRAQYTPIGYANMVRVIFNVVYRVKTQLRSIGDQRFPERLSMMRAEPRLFDPDVALPTDHRRVHRASPSSCATSRPARSACICSTCCSRSSRYC